MCGQKQRRTLENGGKRPSDGERVRAGGVLRTQFSTYLQGKTSTPLPAGCCAVIEISSDFSESIFHLNCQFLLEFQETRVLRLTVCVEKDVSLVFFVFLVTEMHLAYKCLILEWQQEHEISLEEEEHTLGRRLHFTHSSTKW